MRGVPVKLAFAVYNAFAIGPFTGNPAAVVFGADALDAGRMQAIARQFNLVETVFVTAVDRERRVAALRYFTPDHELPIAGHPTIAAFAALRDFEGFAGDATLQNSLGNLPIRYQINAVMMQQLPCRQLEHPVDPAAVADLFGLGVEDLQPDLPPRCFDLGLGHVIVPLKSLDSLMKVRRDIARLAAFCTAHGVREAQLFCFETKSAAATLHTRNLAPRCTANRVISFPCRQ